jgi:hypothetical protein
VRIKKTLTVALAIALSPLAVQAATYNLTASGNLQTATRAKTCGAVFGDSYDTFCPSDPAGSTTCECDSFTANVNGSVSGSGPGKLTITEDGGAAVDTPDCRPIFGELTFTATGDSETIYLNGSRCNAHGAGGEAVRGGWGIFSSSARIRAFGTLTGSINPDSTYSVTLAGRTQ